MVLEDARPREGYLAARALVGLGAVLVLHVSGEVSPREHVAAHFTLASGSLVLNGYLFPFIILHV